MGVIFRAYVKAANAVVCDIPGGPRGYQVIAAAVQHAADSQGALAQRLGVDRTVMTYLIDDLEAAGLVERRADPVDRRSRHIVATARGQRLWADIQHRLQEVEEHVLGALSTPERATFRELLQRLAARASPLDAVARRCDLVTDVDAALGFEARAAETPRRQPGSRRHPTRPAESS
ncbi:MAG: MarR family winged helix-turn-helix transcriptional regulator [Chloroflexota bacterium]|nr:MarR family winged helix-turn-helix transcriptional regulator [Chloroflexota bacterium]